MTADTFAASRVIVEALACGRNGCACHATAERGHGSTHRVGHEDASPSMTVGPDTTMTAHRPPAAWPLVPLCWPDAAAPRPERREMRTLEAPQVTRLLDATAGDRWHALWVVLATTGLRLGEATGLRWEDLDGPAGQLRVRRALQRQRGKGLVLVEPKTARSRRTVPLTPQALDALRRQRTRQAADRLAAGPAWQEQGLIFCTFIGGPLDPARVNEAFHRALAAADLPRVRVHDLRHGTATLLLALGVPVHDVSALLGHCQASVTLNVYAHVTAHGQTEAVRRLGTLLAAQ